MSIADDVLRDADKHGHPRNETYVMDLRTKEHDEGLSYIATVWNHKTGVFVDAVSCTVFRGCPPGLNPAFRRSFDEQVSRLAERYGLPNPFTADLS